MEEFIKIKGAKENNLRNLDLVLPRNKFIVFSGVSGSGKSTLVFDTIYAECQRKFIESLSSYARQFLGQMGKPNVESIEGLSPAISIDQKTTSHNPRSTVGTVTEIYDYLRLLYARLGTPYCPNCKKPIKTMTIENIVDNIMSFTPDSKLILIAPVVRGQKGSFQKLFEDLQKDGYARVEVDGEIRDLSEEIKLDKNFKHDISVVIDRLKIKEENRSRLNQSIETALKMSKGLVKANIEGEEYLFNNSYACSECGFSFEEISPRLFSFNSPFGACPECAGLGFTTDIDENLLMKNPEKTLRQGALRICGWNIEVASIGEMYMNALSKKYNFSLDVPLKDLPRDIINILLYGNNGEELDLDYSNSKFTGTYKGSWEGLIPNLRRRFVETKSEYSKQEISKLMRETECKTCKGKRLSQQALSVLINKKNIYDLTEMSVYDLKNFLSELKFKESELAIAQPILKEINARLTFLCDVGLNYLTLNRTARTLSGGEAQRIRLATQIGSGLVGVLYILDEPSIGLHQYDNDKLLASLKKLRDLGNTLIVVEHDEETIKCADHIVDIGPYAGVLGGEIVAQGSLEDIIKSEKSLTGKFLSGKEKIEVPAKRLSPKGYINLTSVSQNNLKKINVKIPLGVLTLVTGLSGSGKSSLVNEVLFPALSNQINKTSLPEGKYKAVNGAENIDKIINIDQSPIGRTPRSNPATYIGLFTLIRDLFASTKEAKERGYTSGRFSFNIKGGRCEACEGDGEKKVEMYFLPDVYVTCSECKGKRYNKETLQVKYKGKSISDVLDMTVEEALTFFDSIPSIKNKIQSLYDVGLGYIKLGQSATTLSGGEAQRVKLAAELCKRSTGKTLYILDEPTTGLHSYDIKKLITILQNLVQKGNSVVVIEHNLDVIKVADFIIDLGPEGGDKGGEIVAMGTPEEVAKVKESKTGMFLKRILN